MKCLTCLETVESISNGRKKMTKYRCVGNYTCQVEWKEPLQQHYAVRRLCLKPGQSINQTDFLHC